MAPCAALVQYSSGLYTYLSRSIVWKIETHGSMLLFLLYQTSNKPCTQRCILLKSAHNIWSGKRWTDCYNPVTLVHEKMSYLACGFLHFVKCMCKVKVLPRCFVASDWRMDFSDASEIAEAQSHGQAPSLWKSQRVSCVIVLVNRAVINLHSPVGIFS